MDYTVNRASAGNITIIQQIDTETKEVINEYYSTRKAAQAIGKPNLWSNIAKACRQGKLCCGFEWKYEKLG